MLTYRWVESNSGPPRKYFSLTDQGLSFYQELDNTWQEMVSAVDTVIQSEASPVINTPTAGYNTETP
jgi:PadR family transcriptional regulator PadR